jgi:hypothetical protein
MSDDIDYVMMNTIKEEMIKRKSRSLSKTHIEHFIKKCNKSTLKHIYLTIPLTSFAKIILLENIVF